MSFINDEIFKNAITELETNSGWVIEKDELKNGGVLLATKKKLKSLGEETSIDAVKVTSVIPYPTELVFRVFQDTSKRTQWTKSLVESRHIVQCNGDLLKGGEDVVYNRTHPPGFLVSARDFVIARRWTPKDGGFDWVMTSIVHKDCPEKEGVVRARTILQAVRMRPVEKNKTIVTLINQVDPGGWVPSTVANFTQRKIPEEFITSLANGCDIFLKQKK